MKKQIIPDRLKAKIIEKQVLSNNWAEYSRYKLAYTKKDGTVEEQFREVHDSGNGATILLYNLKEETFLVTRQFRLPTFLNGNKDGMMLECCAGIVENESPEQAIKREILEELGYEIEEVKYLYNAYATPGAKTEKIFFFFAPYCKEMKKQKGGGKAEEHEEIEIVELKFQEAFQMIIDGSICDAKTIILLLQFRLDFGL